MLGRPATGGADTAAVTSSIRILTLALLAVGTMLHGSSVDAQARQLPQVKYEAEPPVEMDVWLRRLVGRFNVEGAIQFMGSGLTAIKGAVDCVGVGVGTGPGVQCMLNMSWTDAYLINYGDDPDSPIGIAAPVPGAVSYLDPAAILFGLDPGKAAINHLLVDNKGLAEGGLGANIGNWATFRTSCVNEPGIVGGCERIFRIEARPDSRLIWMWIDVEMGPKGTDPPVSSIVLTLRRVAQDDGEIEPAPSATVR